MIVRHFLQWVRTAPPGERAEATSALARSFLYSDLSPDDLGAAEGAMLMLLDDPSPLVRRALAGRSGAHPLKKMADDHCSVTQHRIIAVAILKRAGLTKRSP